MDLITRQFTVKRGDKNIIYPFTTYPVIFSDTRETIQKPLFKYLRDVFVDGIPARDFRTVTQEPPLICDISMNDKDCNLARFAKDADYVGKGNKQHECVQNYLLKNDPSTLAIEVPVWGGDVLGHIDILQLYDDKIVVADFKPFAHLETKAGGQVLRYISFLSKNTGLPLRYFEGVYFDNENCYFLNF